MDLNNPFLSIPPLSFLLIHQVYINTTSLLSFTDCKVIILFKLSLSSSLQRLKLLISSLTPPTCSHCRIDIQGILLHFHELLQPVFFIKGFPDGCFCPTHGWASRHLDEFFRNLCIISLANQFASYC